MTSSSLMISIGRRTGFLVLLTGLLTSLSACTALRVGSVPQISLPNARPSATTDVVETTRRDETWATKVVPGRQAAPVERVSGATPTLVAPGGPAAEISVENMPIPAFINTVFGETLKLPFDIDRDLQPVALITQGPNMLVASPSLPVSNVRDIIEYTKKNPGKVSIASSTNGSPGHLAAMLFIQSTGTDIEHVPYKGGAPAITDLIAGRVQLMFEGMNSIGPQVKAGKLKAIAVTSAQRNGAFPDVPTLVEQGSFEITTWQGMVAPAGVPRPILERVNAAVNRAVASPTFQKRMAEIGNEGGGGSIEQFTAFSRAERQKWGDVIRKAGIKLE